MVAHFNYYRNTGNGTSSIPAGVVLIPFDTLGVNVKMNNTDTSSGGYKASIPHTTTLPDVVTALQTIFGSYLLDIKALISNNMNANISSMAGAGLNGASTSWEWVSTKCILPTEVQVFGSTIWSSSALDVGEGCEKLALFNFFRHTRFQRSFFWLRAVVSSTGFALAGNYGDAAYGSSSVAYGLRPLIYIS